MMTSEHELSKRGRRDAKPCRPERAPSLRRQIAVVVLAHVVTATTAPSWGDAKGSLHSQIAALGEIAPQGGLNDGRQRCRHLLRLEIAIHSRGEVIGDGDRDPFHNWSFYRYFTNPATDWRLIRI